MFENTHATGHHNKQQALPLFKNRGNNMTRLRGSYHIILAVSLLATGLWTPTPVLAQDADSKVHVPEGVYINLTREFYESLKGDGKGGAKVYSNDPSIEYLKEIAISSRFMVETNLQILRQQERILQLLQSVLDNKKR